MPCLLNLEAHLLSTIVVLKPDAKLLLRSLRDRFAGILNPDCCSFDATAAGACLVDPSVSFVLLPCIPPGREQVRQWCHEHSIKWDDKILGWDPAWNGLLWQPIGVLEGEGSHLSKNCPGGSWFSQCPCLPSVCGTHFLSVWANIVWSEKSGYDFSWAACVPQDKQEVNWLKICGGTVAVVLWHLDTWSAIRYKNHKVNNVTIRYRMI